MPGKPDLVLEAHILILINILQKLPKNPAFRLLFINCQNKKQDICSIFIVLLFFNISISHSFILLKTTPIASRWINNFITSQFLYPRIYTISL
jgi:hypothetical protein